MAITRVDMPAQRRVLTGMDWREVQKQLPAHADKIIMIDMTIEKRNRISGSHDWRYINIPTPDFSTPDWTAQQWLDLAALVYNETDPDSRKRSNVFVACQGGQGRTGIALAILRAAIEGVFVAPVKAIRTFNPHLIETPGQEAYVKRIVKELDELTKPAPAPVAPVDWPERAGKAEKRVAELEAEVKRLKNDRDASNELARKTSAESDEAFRTIARVWELVNPFVDNENLEMGDYDE